MSAEYGLKVSENWALILFSSENGSTSGENGERKGDGNSKKFFRRI